jgi:hypothetical protein
VDNFKIVYLGWTFIKNRWRGKIGFLAYGSNLILSTVFLFILGPWFYISDNIFLLYSTFYYYSFSLGRNFLAIFTSRPLLFSGRDSIFRANTSLLYFAFYYYSLSSDYNPSVILASCPFSRVTNILLILVTNLSLRVIPYYGLVL